MLKSDSLPFKDASREFVTSASTPGGTANAGRETSTRDPKDKEEGMVLDVREGGHLPLLLVSGHFFIYLLH